MMRRFFSVLLLAIFPVSSWAVDVIYNVSDFTTKPQSVCRVTISPLYPYGVNSTNILTADKIRTQTGTNGSVTVSNVVVGYAYRVEISGSTVITVFTNSFPTNASGTVSATAYMTASTNLGPSSVAYSQASANQLFPTYSVVTQIVQDAVDAAVIDSGSVTPEVVTNISSYVIGTSNLLRRLGGFGTNITLRNSALHDTTNYGVLALDNTIDNATLGLAAQEYRPNMDEQGLDLLWGSLALVRSSPPYVKTGTNTTDWIRIATLDDLAPAAVSNATVKPILKATSTTNLFSLESGSNVVLSMTETSIVVNSTGGGSGTTYSNSTDLPGVISGSTIGTNLSGYATTTQVSAATNDLPTISAGSLIEISSQTNGSGVQTNIIISYTGGTNGGGVTSYTNLTDTPAIPTTNGLAPLDSPNFTGTITADTFNVTNIVLGNNIVPVNALSTNSATTGYVLGYTGSNVAWVAGGGTNVGGGTYDYNSLSNTPSIPSSNVAWGQITNQPSIPSITGLATVTNPSFWDAQSPTPVNRFVQDDTYAALYTPLGLAMIFGDSSGVSIGSEAIVVYQTNVTVPVFPSGSPLTNGLLPSVGGVASNLTVNGTVAVSTINVSNAVFASGGIPLSALASNGTEGQVLVLSNGVGVTLGTVAAGGGTYDYYALSNTPVNPVTQNYDGVLFVDGLTSTNPISAPDATATNQLVTLAQLNSSIGQYRSWYFWSGSNSTVNTNANALRTLDYGQPPLGTNTVAGVTNGQYITYCSPAANLTELKSGTYYLNATIWKSVAGAVSLAGEIYIRHTNGTEVEITPVSGTAAQSVGDTALEYIFTLVVSSNVTILATDSIEVKFKASGISGSPTVYISSGTFQSPVPSSQFALSSVYGISNALGFLPVAATVTNGLIRTNHTGRLEIGGYRDDAARGVFAPNGLGIFNASYSHTFLWAVSLSNGMGQAANIHEMYLCKQKSVAETNRLYAGTWGLDGDGTMFWSHNRNWAGITNGLGDVIYRWVDNQSDYPHPNHMALTNGSLWVSKRYVSTPVTLTYSSGTNITVDFSLGNKFALTLTNNAYFVSPTNGFSMQDALIEIRQDATGGRTVTFTNQWKFPGGQVLTFTTNANAMSLMSVMVGTTLTNANVVQTLNFQ